MCKILAQHGGKATTEHVCQTVPRHEPLVPVAWSDWGRALTGECDLLRPFNLVVFVPVWAHCSIMSRTARVTARRDQEIRNIVTHRLIWTDDDPQIARLG